MDAGDIAGFMIYDIWFTYNLKCLVQNVQYCVYTFSFYVFLYDFWIIGTAWLNYSILIFASDVVVPYSDVMNTNSHKNIDLPQRHSGVNQYKVNSLVPSAFHLQWSTNGEGPNGSRIPTIEVVEASELVTPKSTNPQEWYLSYKSKSSYLL